MGLLFCLVFAFYGLTIQEFVPLEKKVFFRIQLLFLIYKCFEFIEVG